MSAIGPGDWVEFLGDRPGTAGPARLVGKLEVGRLYVVRALKRGWDALAGGVSEGVQLVGVYGYHADGAEGAWHPALFRPVYRPREDLIATLLEPLPAEVREVEEVG
jgi:hypothetical protein